MLEKQQTHLYEMEDYTRLAGEYPLSEAYPLMCWVIQNAVLRFRGGDQEISNSIQCSKRPS